MITKTQTQVLRCMRHGAVIGELSDKINGRYELFTRKPHCFRPKSWPDHPFIIQTLNKNTVFALLTLGEIEIDNSIAEQMKPFGRDCWYVFKANQ